MTFPLRKLISGGQQGADFAGLVAAKELGLETGGTAPKEYRICLPDGSDGNNLKLKEYGLVESDSYEYPPRTRQNVLDSDGTVWFGYTDSPGGKLTINTCIANSKPYIINPTPEQLRIFVETNNIAVLNVAGNRVSAFNPDIDITTYDTIIKAFKYA